ncbi:MAG: hypothetical protein IGS38_18995 [Synechococcales cyanobacterium M58_A2018_015]|nr:hypothetical protein [Synechococcales cyanobacterium M58_A2018_015]
MGTDIYLYAEIKKHGTWQPLSLAEQGEHRPEYCPESDPEDYLDSQLSAPVEIYNSRNDDLFAILGDVRNPTGRTLNDQPFDVIAPPRGLPEDLSIEIRSMLNDWECETGSGVSGPSWLLLSEVLEFDWYGKFMCYQAMVDARVAHLFEESKPFPYDPWPKEIPIGYATYMRDGVIVRWTDTYADAAGQDFMDLLNTLKQQGEPSQIRLVFWFDH